MAPLPTRRTDDGSVEWSERWMQIGDVGERTGLSHRTIRYYEDVGLLPASERTAGGFRLYTEDAVQRLLVIKQMKPLDFSLEEMRELLTALDALASGDLDDSSRHDLRDVVLRYQHEVGERMDGLRRKLRAAGEFQASLEARAAGLSGRAVSEPTSDDLV